MLKDNIYRERDREANLKTSVDLELKERNQEGEVYIPVHIEGQINSVGFVCIICMWKIYVLTYVVNIYKQI